MSFLLLKMFDFIRGLFHSAYGYLFPTKQRRKVICLDPRECIHETNHRTPPPTPTKTSSYKKNKPLVLREHIWYIK